MVSGVYLLGIKRPERESDRSSPCNVKLQVKHCKLYHISSWCRAFAFKNMEYLSDIRAASECFDTGIAYEHMPQYSQVGTNIQFW